jgi:hypothetical protein
MALHSSNIIYEDDFNYFKQVNIYKTVHFPNKCISLKKSISATTELKILSTKVIDTFQGTSIEGQCLTGKKLIILGCVNVILLIPYANCKNKDFLKKVSLPFSDYIIVPKECCSNQPINLKHLIEDCTVKAITTHELLVSVTTLFQYLDEYI